MITPEQETLLMVRGSIASLSMEKQIKVINALAKIEAICQEYGEEAYFVIALVGAGLAAKE